jgi:putative tryptophan/tyrosine transport system substrate-binding protein
MSAVWSLTGGKRTSCGQPNLVEFDPKRTYRRLDFSLTLHTFGSEHRAVGRAVKRREFVKLVGGAVAAWPFAARAEQPNTPIIGFLHGANDAPFIAGFRQGLKEAGFTDGKNVSVEYRWADGHYDRLPGLAADLVGRSVSVIVANTPAAPIVKAATGKIPIVFVTGDDPVESGLVKSLNRPGGNMTGITLISSVLGSKQLGLLRELVPATTSVAFLTGPNNAVFARTVNDTKTAGQALWQHVHVLNANTADEIETAFATMAQERIGALVVVPDTFLVSRRDQIVALAARHAVPTMYQFRDYTLAGGLVSYGASLFDQYRQGGVYTGMILKGANPAELPVLQPTKFELVLNSKTAKTLGLVVSPGFLALADEVIE